MKTTASVKQDGAARGDLVTNGEAVGRFVGTTARGLIWIAWVRDDYDQMCKTFDVLER